VAIVTGASRGLGRAFAVDLAQCGASLVITARTDADLAGTAEDACAIPLSSTPNVAVDPEGRLPP
jgi:NAD(P)-dependent dehydrogenase (short-subunit alcohol dehydrogenase family)